MDIKEINRRHFFETDKHYRIGFGLCSNLIAFRNGIIYLEIMFGKKWSKDYTETTRELAYCWKNKNLELSKAIGCKVYIIDAKRHAYKRNLYFNSKPVSYDAKKGILFRENILN